MLLDDYMQLWMIFMLLCMFDCDVYCDVFIVIVLFCCDVVCDGCYVLICIELIGVVLNQFWFWDQIFLIEMVVFDVGWMMWQCIDYILDDVDLVQFYDGFLIFIMIWLEVLGLCLVGESGVFVEGGQCIVLDGSLLININGGQLFGGCIYGLGYVYEVCL